MENPATEDTRLHGFRRIVFVSMRFPDVSGGTTAVLQVADALAEIGAEVEFLSVFPGNGGLSSYPVETLWVDEALERQPLRALVDRSFMGVLTAPLLLGRKLWQRARARRVTRQWISGLASDCVVVITHVHAMKALHNIGFDPRKCGAALVGQHHSQFRSLHLEALEEDFLRYFQGLDAFVALTPVDAMDFSKVVDARTYAIANMLVPSRLRSAHTNRRAIAVGRLSAEKQFHLLVEAFARATRTEQLRDWKLDIFGEGQERRRIQEAIDAAGAADRIQLRGETSCVREEMAASSVSLSTSLIEGFGMTILEAASVKVPSIAFACSPGVRSLIPEGAGALVEEQTAVGMEQALCNLLGDLNKLSVMGERALEHSKNYEPSRVMELWFDLLESLRASHGTTERSC